MMDKKYLIAGGVAVVGLVAFVKLRSRSSASDSNDAGMSMPAMMYTPGSMGGSAGGGGDIAMPDLGTNAPQSASLSDLMGNMFAMDAMGKIASTLGAGGSVSFGDKTLTIKNPIEEQNRALVSGLYTSIGRSNPDDQGIAYWLNKLRSGESVSTVQKQFLTSATTFANDPTYASNAAQAQNILHPVSDTVRSLYSTIGRTDPDAQGMAYWQSKIDAGANPNDVKQQFLTAAAGVSDPQYKDNAEKAKALLNG